MTGPQVIALALALCVPLRAARAEDACEDEAKAVGKRKDPALNPPTDTTAAERMKAGNRHHREAKKFAGVLKQEEAAREYAAAIDEYIAAALIDSAPSLLYNLGQTYRASGQYEKAIKQYQLFLERGSPGTPLRALVECHVASMKAELDRAAASTPPSDPAPETAEGDPAVAMPSVAGPVAAPAVRQIDGPPWYADGLGWTGVGVGVLGGAAGIMLLLDADSLRGEAEREDRDDVRTELRAKADERQTWGTVAGLIGAVALSAGVVKLILTPEARIVPATSEAGVSLWLAPSSLGLQGRF